MERSKTTSIEQELQQLKIERDHWRDEAERLQKELEKRDKKEVYRLQRKEEENILKYIRENERRKLTNEKLRTAKEIAEKLNVSTRHIFYLKKERSELFKKFSEGVTPMKIAKEKNIPVARIRKIQKEWKELKSQENQIGF